MQSTNSKKYFEPSAESMVDMMIFKVNVGAKIILKFIPFDYEHVKVRKSGWIGEWDKEMGYEETWDDGYKDEYTYNPNGKIACLDVTVTKISIKYTDGVYSSAEHTIYDWRDNTSDLTGKIELQSETSHQDFDGMWMSIGFYIYESKNKLKRFTRNTAGTGSVYPHYETHVERILSFQVQKCEPALIINNITDVGPDISKLIADF